MDEELNIDETMAAAASEIGLSETSEPAPAEPTPAEEALAYPKSWRQEISSHWSTLPREVQQEVLRREGDILKGINTYKAGHEAWGRLAPVFQPYQQLMQQHNLSPEQILPPLLRAHHDMSVGDQAAKEATFRNIAKAYGLEGLLAAAEARGETPWTDPNIQALQEKVNGLGSTVDTFVRTAQEMQMKEIGNQLDTFAKDKPHFEEVAPRLPALIRGGMTLEEAYEAAVWGNPALREKVLQEKAAAELKASQAKQAETLARARRASQPNVRPAGGPGQPTAPTGTMDDTLAETLRELKSRS
jgi:hypothetical protein